MEPPNNGFKLAPRVGLLTTRFERTSGLGPTKGSG